MSSQSRFCPFEIGTGWRLNDSAFWGHSRPVFGQWLSSLKRPLAWSDKSGHLKRSNALATRLFLCALKSRDDVSLFGYRVGTSSFLGSQRLKGHKHNRLPLPCRRLLSGKSARVTELSTLRKLLRPIWVLLRLRNWSDPLTKCGASSFSRYLRARPPWWFHFGLL